MCPVTEIFVSESGISIMSESVAAKLHATVVVDPVPYATLSGKEDGVILGSPTLATLGIDVYDSTGEYARKRNLSVQGVESSNFRKCRWVSIAEESPEPPDEAVERMVSRGSDMGMESKQEEHKRAVALAKAVVIAAAIALSSKDDARLREPLDRHWTAFRRGLRGDPPAVSSH